MNNKVKTKDQCTVVMVGTSEKSGGGITSVIKLIRMMPVWEKYGIYWLATQEDGNKLTKLWRVIKSACKTPFVIAQCQIVHFHMVPGITLLTQLPELLWARLLRKNIIMEVHVGNQLELYASDRFFKWWFKQADLVLLLARKWESLLKEYYSDVHVATDVLYNACEIRESISIEEKKNLIIFAGTINDNKAPDLLLKAWSKLIDKYPDWRIVFLGSGNITYYQQMAEKLKVSDKIEFTGYIVGERKERFFREASILCMCSYMEGFPMTVLEAWSHSIAVVTTPVGGLPDVIEEGINCLTFPYGDSEALAQQLDRLIVDRTLRRQIAQEGYKLAENQFSIYAVNKKLDDIYQQLLNN